MLSKEEFKKEDLLSALQELDCSRNCPCCKYFDNNTQKCQDPTPYAVDLLEEFIQEHFELVEKYEMLSNTYSMFCEDYLNPKSYKFEDLKELDYVYDKKEDEIVLIIGTSKNHRTNEKFVRTLVFGYEEFNEVSFKENRFYPVYIAK